MLILLGLSIAAVSLAVLNSAQKPKQQVACKAYCSPGDKTADSKDEQLQYEPEGAPLESSQASSSQLYARYLSSAGLLSIPPGKLSVTYASPTFNTINITRDIPYKYTANKTMNPGVTDPVTLLLNLYEPIENTNTDRPVLIFVYGGGMCVGDRLQQEQSAIAFAKYGYVTATIDYRMRYDLCGISDGTVDEEDIPAYYAEFILSMKDVTADILDAKSYLANQATSLGISNAKFGVVGWSVGGTTSESILLQDFDNQRHGIGGIATLSGFFPVDPLGPNPSANLGTLSSQRPLPAVLAVSHDVDAGFRGVDADAGRDCLYISAQGASCTYVELPGEGHPLDAFDHVVEIIPFFKNTLGL